MKKNLFKRYKKFLPLIGIIIFIITLFFLDLSKIKTSLLSIHPIFIIASLSLTFPRLIIRNYEWQIIQKEQKININFWISLKIFLIGYFYGSITPGYFGQLMRIPYMKEKTNQAYGKIFVNVIIEIIIHSLSLYGMIFIGAIIVFGSFPQIFYGIVIYLIIQTLIIIYFIKKERGEKTFRTLIKYLIPKKLKQDLNKFVNSFYDDFPKIYRLIPAFIVGIPTWIIIFTQEYIIVIALGLDIPYLYFLLLFPVANAMGFIPVTFAGLGTREATSIIIFTVLFGVGKEEVFVFTLLGFVLTDIVTGLIGFILSLTENKKIRFPI